MEPGGPPAPTPGEADIQLGAGRMPEQHPHAPPRRAFPRLRAAVRRRRRLDHTHYDGLNDRITRIELRLNQRLNEMSDAIMGRSANEDLLLTDMASLVRTFERRLAEIEQTDSIASTPALRAEVERLAGLVEVLRYEVARREERLDSLVSLLGDVSASFSSAALRYRESS